MIGDQERQRLAELKAQYMNLDEYTREHVKNLYDQIADTDKTISKLEKQLRDIAEVVRKLK